MIRFGGPLDAQYSFRNRLSYFQLPPGHPRADNLPYPSKKSIAQRIGKTEKTVQRRIAKLEKAGFIRRQPRYSAAKGQLSNIYDFAGLIKEATPFAHEAIQRKKDLMAEGKDRATRKKPKLRIVKDEEA